MSSGAGQAPKAELSWTAALLRFLELVKYENLAAGVSGGVISTLVLHPLDLVKIRFAVSDGLQMRPKYNGIVHCFRSIWKQEGIRGLYQGVTPNVWGAGLSWGLYFFFYNAIKAYKQNGHPEQLSATQHLISAAEAGAVTLCITNPIWVTKTRLVLQYDAGFDPLKKQYRGMLHALLKIYQNEGVRGLYKGFVPGLFGTSHGALQFMAYEELKKEYSFYKNVAVDVKLNPIEYVTMAALSKVFAVTATYPYQVVRARLQDQHTQYSGVMNAIGRTWRVHLVCNYPETRISELKKFIEFDEYFVLYAKDSSPNVLRSGNHRHSAYLPLGLSYAYFIDNSDPSS